MQNIFDNNIKISEESELKDKLSRKVSKKIEGTILNRHNNVSCLIQKYSKMLIYL